MGYDKIVDSAALDAALGGIADAIRAQTGGEGLLGLEEMAAAIGGIKNACDYLAEVLNKQVTELIGDKVTEKIPSGFQQGNKNLTVVDLPNTVGMGESVFDKCNNLKTVNLPALKTMAAGCFGSTLSLKTLYLPELTTITGWGYVFNGSNVEKVIFPKLVSQLAAGDFNNCKYLVALVLGANSVCTLTNANAFNGTPIKSGTGYIYVPAAQLAAYKAATNWSTYASQFRAIEDYPGIMEV